MSAAAQQAPVVGDGGTVLGYSDRRAVSIVEVKCNGKKIVVRDDTATLLNGFGSGEPDALVFSPGGFCGHTSGTQRYAYAPNPNGAEQAFTLRADGSWRRVGSKHTEIVLGQRSHHYDYNF